MKAILNKLKGGDLRSKGKSEEVVADIVKEPFLFSEVFEGMINDDPVVRMRAADAIEKVSRLHPEYLKAYKQRLINEVSKIEQQEVRWHVAQMFSCLELNSKERELIVDLLFSWIEESNSNIVRVNSMQTLSDMAEENRELRLSVLEKLKEIVQIGSPSMISRGKMLIKKLKNL
jgi:hypothetical protein